MKLENKLKVVLTITVIILISLISFGGIYFKKANTMMNIIPEYKLGMDLESGRIIGIEPDRTINTVIYDKDGKVVEQETEETIKKEEAINKEETLTKENFDISKAIIEKRLKGMETVDYNIRLEASTGKMYIQIPEDKNTDVTAQYLMPKGEFKVLNEEGTVLLDNGHLKKAQVGYNNTERGVNVYLSINFNKEGTEIFKDLTNTYKTAKDEEGNDISKKITIKVDDITLLSTSFEQEIANGSLTLAVGSTSNNNDTIQGYAKEARNMATILNEGRMPIKYKMNENKLLMSDITKDTFKMPVIAILVVILVGMIALVIIYKKNGALASVSLIGYIATLLLIIRYTNVVLTLEGLVGILISIAINYISVVYLLKLIKNKEQKTREDAILSFKETVVKVVYTIIPAIIISIVMCFVPWLPIFSFGMTMFWGLILIVIYNLLVTKILFINSVKE